MQGTNYFTGTVNGVNPALIDATGNGFLVGGASASAVSGYAVGCLLVGTPENKLYINTGTTTTATWTVVGSQS